MGSEIKNAVKPEVALAVITKDWTEWAEACKAKRWVVGVSGGVDSTVVLSLAAKIFGKENVWGVMLPCGSQRDISDSEHVIALTGVHRMLINIADSVGSLERGYSAGAKDGGITSDQAHINLPPRIRLAALYMVAQSVGAMVLNTSNLSEDVLGYATLWGDTCGSYAPIQGLTKSEVVALAEYIGVPRPLAYKTPADGLQEKSDEERLGLTYSEVDKYIRDDGGEPELKYKVQRLYRANRFKLDMISLPGPKFDDSPNCVIIDHWTSTIGKE